MEEKTIITSYINEKAVLDKHEIFLYKCLERKIVGKKVLIKFSRDDNKPYINEIKTLEMQYPNYLIGSMLPTFICPIISLLLLTAFLISFFVTKPNFNFVLFFCIFVIPAILSLLIAVLTMILRVRTISNIEKEKPEVDRKFKEKVQEILSKH